MNAIRIRIQVYLQCDIKTRRDERIIFEYPMEIYFQNNFLLDIEKKRIRKIEEFRISFQFHLIVSCLSYVLTHGKCTHLHFCSLHIEPSNITNVNCAVVHRCCKFYFIFKSMSFWFVTFWFKFSQSKRLNWNWRKKYVCVFAARSSPPNVCFIEN